MIVSDRVLQLCVIKSCLLVMVVTLCVVFILSACVHNCDGNLRFASYYGDHMVLQQSPERAVLWGYGPEGAQVTVSLSGPIKQKPLVVTVTKGIWRVSLDPVEAGGPYIVIAAVQNATAVLTDVLFGDVWLCGGQSNMYFKTSQIFNASQELALAAKYPHVRPFMAALRLSETELIDLIQVELPWSVPTARGVAEFSAVCWLFGRYMYETLKYPIGLVESCWGGTPVEAWSSSRALQQCELEQTKDGVYFCFRIHPRDKQDVAYRLTLGARAIAYNEKDVLFLGPFPKQILSTHKYVNITYDQTVSVTPSKGIFEICCLGTKAPCEPKSPWVPVPIMQWGVTTVLLPNLCGGEVAALRYAWKDWPCDFKACPIYSRSRILPAPPFIINAAEGNVWKSY
ncbi:sialate O-acetylesterase [Morone saxatilis]|uniref:sialate O-acetylesterase n=1 Tax=Morone saxatilis TaxID=34816 RepID=UPI0015E1F1DA|nr:sialate O-acetylesterase [Morone saxatilis]